MRLVFFTHLSVSSVANVLIFHATGSPFTLIRLDATYSVSLTTSTFCLRNALNFQPL